MFYSCVDRFVAIIVGNYFINNFMTMTTGNAKVIILRVIL